MMKLCKDCKHVLLDSAGKVSQGSRCGADGAGVGINPVTGEGDRLFALTCRVADVHCGPNARWFEQSDLQTARQA